MSCSTQDNVTGRVKEGTGAITEAGTLKHQGQQTQAARMVTATVEKEIDKLKDVTP